MYFIITLTTQRRISMRKAIVCSPKGRKFIVVVEGRFAYVGTTGVISNFGAQLICLDIMEKSGMKSTGMCKDFELDGYMVPGLQYKIPLFVFNPIKKINKIINKYYR